MGPLLRYYIVPASAAFIAWGAPTLSLGYYLFVTSEGGPEAVGIGASGTFAAAFGIVLFLFLLFFRCQYRQKSLLPRSLVFGIPATIAAAPSLFMAFVVAINIPVYFLFSNSNQEMFGLSLGIFFAFIGVAAIASLLSSVSVAIWMKLAYSENQIS